MHWLKGSSTNTAGYPNTYLSPMARRAELFFTGGNNTSNIGIQIGLNIHHHDQVATTPQPPSLSVRKIKNRTVPNPSPLDVFLLSAITFISIS
jgi:hypothetical protein